MDLHDVQSPARILTVCRDIFKASHWIDGAFSAQRWDHEKETWKAGGCAVGGMRYAALAPMDHALDEAWMLANFSDLAEPSLENTKQRRELSIQQTDNYLTAIEALAAVVRPLDYERYQDELAAREEDESEDAVGPMTWGERVTTVEEFVIGWNDSFLGGEGSDEEHEETRKEVVEDEILPAFDEAIRSLQAA